MFILIFSHLPPFFCGKIGGDGSIAEAVTSSGVSIRCSGESEIEAVVEKIVEEEVGATWRTGGIYKSYFSI